MISEVLYNYSWLYWKFVFKCDNYGYHDCPSVLLSCVHTVLCWYHFEINKMYSVESCCNGLNCFPQLSASPLCQRLPCSTDKCLPAPRNHPKAPVKPTVTRDLRSFTFYWSWIYSVTFIYFFQAFFKDSNLPGGDRILVLWAMPKIVKARFNINCSLKIWMKKRKRSISSISLLVCYIC